MFSRLINGKVWIPLTPSIPEDGTIFDGLREMDPSEDGYEDLRRGSNKRRKPGHGPFDGQNV